MSDLAELQDAVRRVPGVARAIVRWPDPEGPAALQVEFSAGADRKLVTETVVRTMVEVGHVDLQTMQVDAEPANQAREGRPIFTQMQIDRHEDQVHVEVTLATLGSMHVGSSEFSIHESRGLVHVAEAAVMAVNEFAKRPVYEVVRVDQLGAGGQDVQLRASGADDQVTVQIRAGDTTLLGAALVHGDAREAVVRAVLDAVNRHVIHLPA